MRWVVAMARERKRRLCDPADIALALAIVRAVRVTAPDPMPLHQGIRMACDSIIARLEAVLASEVAGDG